MQALQHADDWVGSNGSCWVHGPLHPHACLHKEAPSLVAARGCIALSAHPNDAILLTHVSSSLRSLNSVMDVTNGVLYLVISVPNPSKPQTTVVTVLQDAQGAAFDTRPYAGGLAHLFLACGAACHPCRRQHSCAGISNVRLLDRDCILTSLRNVYQRSRA